MWLQPAMLRRRAPSRSRPAWPAHRFGARWGTQGWDSSSRLSLDRCHDIVRALLCELDLDLLAVLQFPPEGLVIHLESHCHGGPVEAHHRSMLQGYLARFFIYLLHHACCRVSLLPGLGSGLVAHVHPFHVARVRLREHGSCGEHGG